MISLINCRHFHLSLKMLYLKFLKSSLKILKRDPKHKGMDKAQIEKALRQSSNSGLLRKTILKILSKEVFLKRTKVFFCCLVFKQPFLIEQV